MSRMTAAAAATVVALAACSPDSTDFKSEAEKYIESRDFSEDAELLRYTEAECEEPASTGEDTRYTCTATAQDASQWLFDVLITGESSLEVLVPPRPLSDGATPDNTPDTTPASPESSPTGSTETAADATASSDGATSEPASTPPATSQG